jgi:L-proline amide hydrolase
MKHEADGTIDSPEYQEAKSIFYGQHSCRIKALLGVLIASIKASQEDTTVNYTMYVHPAPIFSFFSCFLFTI